MKSYFFTSYAATYRTLSVTSVLPEAKYNENTTMLLNYYITYWMHRPNQKVLQANFA